MGLRMVSSFKSLSSFPLFSLLPSPLEAPTGYESRVEVRRVFVGNMLGCEGRAQDGFTFIACLDTLF